MTKLSKIEIDDAGLPPPTPEIEQERRVAIFDLLEENSFSLPGKETPDLLTLLLSIKDRRLVFDIQSETEDKVAEFHLSLSPFRQIVKDYFQICESYFDAVKKLSPAQIETIDMARRGIHNEGSRVLQERLNGKVDLDTDTARRLFTLVCVLHFGG